VFKVVQSEYEWNVESQKWWQFSPSLSLFTTPYKSTNQVLQQQVECTTRRQDCTNNWNYPNPNPLNRKPERINSHLTLSCSLCLPLCQLELGGHVILCIVSLSSLLSWWFSRRVIRYRFSFIFGNSVHLATYRLQLIYVWILCRRERCEKYKQVK